MTDISRGDILTTMLTAGQALERARNLTGMDRIAMLASVDSAADEISKHDPVAGGVIREAVLRVLHGEHDTVEATTTVHEHNHLSPADNALLDIFPPGGIAGGVIDGTYDPGGPPPDEP